MSKLALVPVVSWAKEPPQAPDSARMRDPWAEDKQRTLGMMNSLAAVATERLLEKFDPEQWRELTAMEQLAYTKLALDMTGAARRMRTADEAFAPVGATHREQHLGSQLRALAGKLTLPELKVVEPANADRKPDR